MSTNPAKERSELQRPEPTAHGQGKCRSDELASKGDGVIVTDARGFVTSVNPVAQCLTGWTQAEAAGVPLESVFRVVNEDTRETVVRPPVHTMRGGVFVGRPVNNLLIAKDGKERLIDESTATFHDANGEIAGVVMVFREVNERKRQGQAVPDALPCVEDFMATMREPFLVLDGGLRVRAANASFSETFLIPKEEAEGCPLYDLGDGQWDFPRLRALMEQVRSAGLPIRDFEIEHDFPTIGRRNLLLNAYSPPQGSEHPELYLLAFKDVTAERRSQASMQVSEERYRRLFETAKDGILILNADTGKIIDANPFLKELLGYEAEHFIDKELWEIGLFEDREANQAAYQRLTETGYIRYDHLPLKTAGGQETEVEFVSNVYKSGSDKVIQCNIRDISERRRLERQMQEQALALADVSRRKDEFLAMLSHELRNPLAAILNAVEIFKFRQEDDPVQQKSKAIVERQVGQLIHLVDDLLEVSRISTGIMVLQSERCEATDIVGRAVESVRHEVMKHEHKLSVSLSPAPIWLLADPSRLEQVVVNLVVNAAKYTDPGGHIEVSVLQEGREMVLRVRDTGIGISPGLLPRVFDLFAQADRSIARSQGGLGVGLALVRRLVEMHEGTVEAHSKGLGHGSEFVVRLPMEGSSSLNAASRPKRPMLRVLVVDDNVDYADGISALLRSAGYEVDVVHTGPEALDAVAEFHPDVVVLDIGLPGMDGYEVARRIRQNPTFDGLRVVGLSGYRQEPDSPLARAARFDSFLLKPVLFAKLETCLRP